MTHQNTSIPNTHSHQEKQLAEKVLAHPKFQSMARQKALIGWGFSAVIFAVYVAFIWVIGTSPALLAQKISSSSISTLGIYVGIGVIIFSFLITLVYVALANGKFEKMTQEVVQEVMGDNQ